MSNETLVCSLCETEKSKDQFILSNRNNYCRSCRREYNRNYYKNNTELQNKKKNYRENHKEPLRRWHSQYKKDHRELINEHHTERLKTDINFRLTCRLRARLYAALRNMQKKGSAIKDLGCTLPELKRWLESNFKDGMTWENYGEWHIDHIIPLSRVDLTREEHLRKVCHYTNLQPLWATENLAKGNKISQGTNGLLLEA